MEKLIDSFRKANLKVKILTTKSKEFDKYGRKIDTSGLLTLIDNLENYTEISEHNVYEIDSPFLHDKKSEKELSSYFGGMDIQIGYCNGINSSMNGFEYHKTPEIMVTSRACALFLSLPNTLINFETLDSEKAEVLFLEAGEAIELKPEILHLSPCRVFESGFKVAIILPKGTNTPLPENFKKQEGEKENKILFLKNKWIITHKNYSSLVNKGVHAGINGSNRELFPLN